MRGTVSPILVLVLFLFPGCGPQANHLGNPLLWPVSYPLSLAENAAYGARRNAVAGYLQDNRDAVLAQIARGGGPALNGAYDLARVPVAARPALTARLSSDALSRTDPEALLVAIMVSGR